jgi:hypothetical protein
MLNQQLVGAQSQPQRPSEISTALNELQSSVGGIEAAVERLVERLQVVMRQEPVGVRQENKATGFSCKLGVEIAGLAARAERVLDLLLATEQRLELP